MNTGYAAPRHLLVLPFDALLRPLKPPILFGLREDFGLDPGILSIGE
jgi:hypothetical protein